MFEMWGGQNPNAICFFCGIRCSIGIKFGGLPHCGNYKCIQKWLWREQWRSYWASRQPRKRVEVKNKWAGGINGSRDETERVFSKRYRFQPKYRDMMIAKHRAAVARNMITLGAQRKLSPYEVAKVNEQNEEIDKQYEKKEKTIEPAKEVSGIKQGG